MEDLVEDLYLALQLGSLWPQKAVRRPLSRDLGLDS